MSCEKQKTQVIEDFNIDYNADGIIDSRSTTKSTYDKQGNLTKSLMNPTTMLMEMLTIEQLYQSYIIMINIRVRHLVTS
jgi:hypothetical protein